MSPLPLVPWLFLGRGTAWILGRTPSSAMDARSLGHLLVVPALINVRSTLHKKSDSLDGEVGVPKDDERLLVVP